MKIYKGKLLSVGLAAWFTVASVVSPLMAAAAPAIQSVSSSSSISGYDQYETAAKIAQSGWTGTSDYAILAAGMSRNLIDALAAGPLAAKLNAPILLTEGNSLNKNALDQLNRLKVKKVYITSGSAVIQQSVIDAVKAAATVTEVKSLGGYDASETSVNIAKEMANQGTKISKVVVTGGAGSDALSIAPIAGAQGMPILYSNGAALSNYVLTYLNSLEANLTKTYVIGGTAVISDAVKAKIPGASERYYGNTQYDTNIEVLKNFAGARNKTTYIANGETLVDALAGAPLVVKTSSLILLTDQTLPQASKSYAQANLSSNVIALGGGAVVPSSVLAQLAPTDIVSDDGASVGSSDAHNVVQLKGILKVSGKNVKVQNAKTDYSIYVQGDNVTLNNLTVQGTIFLDPGDNGTANLQNVTATNIVILSGGKQSINLMSVIAQLLDNQSSSPAVHITATGSTQITRTVSSASASFQASSGTPFGMMEFSYFPQAPGAVPTIELIGNFPQDKIVTGSGVKVTQSGGGGGGGGYVSGTTTPSKTDLSSALSSANTLLNSKTVGAAGGNVTQTAHDTFQTAISAATLVFNNTSATQTQIDAQTAALTAATTAFNQAVLVEHVISTQDQANEISAKDGDPLYQIPYPIKVTLDGASIKNASSVYDIALDPGANGTVYLQNVTANNIIILSGGKNSIHLTDVIARLLSNQSRNTDSTHIVATGSQITTTDSYASATFETPDGSFGTIKITFSAQSPNGAPVVELSGTFADTIEVGGGVTLTAAANAIVPNVLVALVATEQDQPVTLNGTFDSIVVNSQANSTVNLGDQTNIRNLVTNTSANINLGSNNRIDNAVTNSSAQINVTTGSSITHLEVATALPNQTVQLTGAGEFANVQVNGLENVVLALGDSTRVTNVVTNSQADIFIPPTASIDSETGTSEATKSGGGTVNQLATLAVDKTDLNTAVSNAKNLITSVTVGTALGNVSQLTHDTFQAAIDAGTAVESSPIATQTQVDAELSALGNATTAFNQAIITKVPTDKTKLITALNNAAQLMGNIKVGTGVGNVSQTAHDAFQGAINVATAIKDDSNAPQTQVDAQVTALGNATAAFNKAIIQTPPVDKAVLTKAISTATTLLGSTAVGTAAGNVAQSARDAFLVAINAANVVKNNTLATQPQVDAQITALTSATTAFNQAIIQPIVVDKTALNTAIGNANTLLGTTNVGTAVGNVSQTTYDTFKAAISSATVVKNDGNATQAQVNAQVSALASATTAFTQAIIQSTTVDKTPLKMAIANAGTKVQATYTAASWSALQSALTTANSVNANPAATAQDVSKATTDLNNAVNELVLESAFERLVDKALEVHGGLSDSDKAALLSARTALQGFDLTDSRWDNIVNPLLTPKVITCYNGDSQAAKAALKLFVKDFGTLKYSSDRSTLESYLDTFRIDNRATFRNLFGTEFTADQLYSFILAIQDALPGVINASNVSLVDLSGETNPQIKDQLIAWTKAAAHVVADPTSSQYHLFATKLSALGLNMDGLVATQRLLGGVIDPTNAAEKAITLAAIRSQILCTIPTTMTVSTTPLAFDISVKGVNESPIALVSLLEWYSSDPSVATITKVSGRLVITALKAGTTIITAYKSGGAPGTSNELVHIVVTVQ